jgi:hypothetical protein
MRYLIELGSPISDIALAAFPEFERVRNDRAGAVIRGPVVDQSDLFTVIARIQTLGLTLCRIEQIDTPDGAAG